MLSYRVSLCLSWLEIFEELPRRFYQSILLLRVCENFSSYTFGTFFCHFHSSSKIVCTVILFCISQIINEVKHFSCLWGKWTAYLVMWLASLLPIFNAFVYLIQKFFLFFFFLFFFFLIYSWHESSLRHSIINIVTSSCSLSIFLLLSYWLVKTKQKLIHLASFCII